MTDKTEIALKISKIVHDNCDNVPHDIGLKIVESLSLSPVGVSSSDNLEKEKRKAYLKGVTEYTIWADFMPNGDAICDAYQEELRQLEN